MDLVSSGPLRVAQIRWYLSHGAPAVTVVCKATFSLRPNESPLAQQQDEPNEDDTYWDDDPQRSLSASTDLVPFKARADVLLIGSAYSAQPVRSLVARLRVGAIDKSIEIHADRAFGADGQLREGMLWSKMRLRYERAAGGPETSNPVGLRFDVHDARGNTVLPNLQPVGATLSRRGDGFAPIGFGPIAPMWRERAMKAHRAAPGWSPYGWSERPLPEGLDPAYFNVAPADQQLESLTTEENILLEHLHPEHPRLSTRLADIVPRATVERQGVAPQALALVCDTLSIDTDRAVVHLVWRAHVRLSHPQEHGRITITTGEDAPAEWESTQAPTTGDRTVAPMGGVSAAMLMPFARKPPEGEPSSRRAAVPNSALPFLSEARGNFGSPHGPVAQPPMPQPPMSQPSMPQPLPQTAPPPMPQAAPLPPPQPMPHSVPQAALPPPVAPPLPAPAPPMPVESSPWASPSAAAAQSRSSIGERIIEEPSSSGVSQIDSDRRRAGEPEHMGSLSRTGENAVPSFLAAAAVAGVVAASNAAADPPPPVPGRRPGRTMQRQTSEAVDLLWFDGESVARIRKRPPWRALLADLESSTEVDTEENNLGNTPEEIEDRRDVLHVLVHGQVVDDYGISEALDGAIRADGKVIHPLVLTAGQLTFAFDELEMLKATLSAAMPFAQGDEPLTAAAASAKEFLSTPGLIATGTVIESLTARLREAFLRTKRPVANDYLTTQSERALLEKRHYQKREVFAKTQLRGLFFPFAAQNPIPAYLPEDVSKKLPLYQRFSVRMIVEVHRAADQNEVHPAALRVLGIARSLPPPR